MRSDLRCFRKLVDAIAETVSDDTQKSSRALPHHGRGLLLLSVDNRRLYCMTDGRANLHMAGLLSLVRRSRTRSMSFTPFLVERIQPCRCGAAILRLLSRLVERIQPCGYRDGEESDWLTEAAVAFASRLF